MEITEKAGAEKDTPAKTENEETANMDRIDYLTLLAELEHR